MANHLMPTVRAYVNPENVRKRYVRLEEMAEIMEMDMDDMEAFAKAAGALYRFPKFLLIKKERLEKFMKHLYKIPGTGKTVQKKYVRIGEGSIIYGIGHHRFIELARAAGATYKINGGTGGTVLISLEIFDEYMERFRQPAVPLKHPLYQQEKGDE